MRFPGLSALPVTHCIQGSLFPNRVGMEQRRDIVFDADDLVLTSRPMLFKEKNRAFRAIWRRDR